MNCLFILEASINSQDITTKELISNGTFLGGRGTQYHNINKPIYKRKQYVLIGLKIHNEKAAKTERVLTTRTGIETGILPGQNIHKNSRINELFSQIFYVNLLPVSSSCSVQLASSRSTFS